MLWLYITIGAYLLFALANIGDKLMVSKYETKPIVYAFYVGALGALSFTLIPFGVIIPGFNHLFWSLCGGPAFVVALYFMYKAFHAGETTRAVTILGGTSPIFTYIFSSFFIPESLKWTEIFAFVVLVIAIIIISWPSKDHDHEGKKTLKKQARFALYAGIAFAASYVFAKYAYAHQPFISGFFWVRMGGFLAALVIYLIPRYKKFIKEDLKKPKKSKKAGLLVAVQILGGAGVVGQSYALSLTSASLVNALQAIQYAFIFLLAAILGRKYSVLKEKFTRAEIIRKIIAIILIGIGLYFLTI
ncbi:EamA family transporter [Candidatus Falkowbacteria bacterium]|nr:EamA family transporter [Candidatus Falkowbacteria bacterium]